MTRRDERDDRTDRKLPVTGEVGSEGGSYADPTNQVAELEGDLGREAEASEPDKGDNQVEEVKKYPTDR